MHSTETLYVRYMPPSLRPSVLLIDTFELLYPALLRLIMHTLENYPSVIAAVPSDEWLAAMLGRPPVTTWPERTSFLAPFPFRAILEVDGPRHLSDILAKGKPDAVASVNPISTPFPCVTTRPSALTPTVIYNRICSSTNRQDSASAATGTASSW